MNDATNNGFSSDSLQSQNQPQSNSEIQSSIPLVNKEIPVKKDKKIKAPDSVQNIDWQQLAHKLREHNRKLLKKVFNLEQNLIDATNQVQEHQEIARQEELTITEQTEKLNYSQEEIAELSQQLEKERQEIKSQQVLINNLSLQLQTAQQQTAKLERECAVVQENYNQKNDELLNLTEQKEELESRLYRQQQQTLQYKAALEKYSAKEKPLEKLPSVKILSRLKHQPIQPWSDEAEDLAINNVLPTVPNAELDDVCSLTKSISNHHAENLVDSSSVTESPVKPQNTNWQAPEIVNTVKEKQPKSIAAVKLPKFQKANQ